MKSRLNGKIKEVAYALRSEILNAEKNPLAEELKLKDIIRGEVEIPDILHTFFTHLIGGLDPHRSTSIRKQRRIRSISADVILATTSGPKIPSKHLQIGLAMKRLRGSKKVI